MKLRVALREEGASWNAYIAEVGTMEGAVLIGSIGIGAVKANPDFKDRFIELMKDVFADGLARSMGVSVEKWDIASAPQHERAGHA